MKNIKEIDKLLIDGKYAEYLKQQTYQVRWLYKNSNKTLTVISQKDVWAVVYKMEQRIRELERGQNLNALLLNASARTNQIDGCRCDNPIKVKDRPTCDRCGEYIR